MRLFHLQTRVFFFIIKGLFWRQFVQNGADPEAWKYLSVSLPTACIAGTLGALLASHCHRLVYATACYILDTMALVKPQSPHCSNLNNRKVPLLDYR